jgi:hypothetical protein
MIEYNMRFWKCDAYLLNNGGIKRQYRYSLTNSEGIMIRDYN